MALFNRVKVTTTTTGTTDLTLSATGVRDSTNGDYLAPAEQLGNNGTGNRLVTYWIVNGASWARGRGVASSDGLTLARDAYEQSWNGTTLSSNTKLSLTGTSTVFLSPRAADLGAASRGRSLALARGALLA